MNNIVEYTKKGKTFYKFKVYTGINPKTGKKSQTTRSGFTTKAAATAERRKIQAQVADGTYWDDDIDAPKTVGELMDEFIKLKAQSVRASTLRNYEQAKKAFKPILDIKMDKLGVSDVLNIIESNKAVMCSEVLNRYLNAFKQAYMYAFTQGYIKRNVMAQIPQLQYDSLKEDKKLKVYTVEELSDFLEKLKGYNFKAYVIARLMAMGGLRVGEACTLTWEDIDMDRCTVSINKTATIVNNIETVGAPKTKRSNRTISIDKTTIDVLKEWRALNSNERYIFPNRAGDGFYRAGTFRNVLRRFFNHHSELKRLNPHGLRHTHASILFENGINPKVIQNRLGHESIETTLDIYVHLYEDNTSLDGVIDVLNNIKG